MKKITTTRVARDFAQSDRITLEITPNTALVLVPGLHSGGVRGQLIRYKKQTGQDWKGLKFEEMALPPGHKITIDLKTETVQKLLEAISVRQEIVDGGIPAGHKNFILAREEEVLVVKDSNKKQIFESVLERGYSDEFWKLLQESEPELATRLSVGHLYSEKIATLKELENRLTKKYPETAGSDSWQSWIYTNNWLFGFNHIRTIEKAKINISGQMPDFLFLTPDLFIDVLEVKLPEEKVIVPDTHPGAFKWCPVTNAAIGQVVHYLSEIDLYHLLLAREIKNVYGIDVSFVKPRAFILVGKKDGWSSEKHAALRKLNFSLHGIEVLTYSDLQQRGSEIANMYREGQENQVSEEIIPF